MIYLDNAATSFPKPVRVINAVYNTALKFAPVVNHLPRFMVYNGLNAWGKGRELPAFAKESFNDMWKNNKVR